MTSFLKACWQRRWFRVLTWISATLLTLFVLFHQWVNWSGAHRWKAAQDMLAREGETLDFHKVAADPVPDAQNFCAIPLLKDLVLDKTPDGRAEANRTKLEAMALPRGDSKGLAKTRPSLNTGTSTGEAVDLKAWANWLREEGSLPVPPDSGNAARDVLAALSKHEPLIAGLVAGLSRAEAQWTPTWRTRELPGLIYEVPLPHFKATQAASQFLALRAIAAAQAGEARQAHDALLVMLRLSRASLADPFLISTLVGMAQDAWASSVTWELCRLHAGTAEDFRRLELEWSKHDMRASLLRAFRGEMAGGATTVQWLRQTRDGKALVALTNSGETNSKGALVFHLVPSGWFDMNAAAMVELNHEYTVRPLRDRGLADCVNRQPDLERWIKSRPNPLWHLDSLFARLALPATSTISARAAQTQDVVNQSLIACALERHRIEHGSCPDSLDAVKRADGQPLPLDLFANKPMGYRKTPDDRYALWCVGRDGKDQGGKRELDDLVWDVAAR